MGSDHITVEGRAIAVPATPISSSTLITSFLSPRIRVQGDRLTLEPNRGMRALGWLFVAWGLAFAALGVSALVFHWSWEMVVVGLLPGVACPLIGLLLIVVGETRHEFDRRAGVYRRRSTLAPAEYPLSDVVAVQAMRGATVEWAEDGSRGLKRPSYELNLVLAGAAVWRQSIDCRIDDGWVTEAGRALSEFLGVPLVGGLAAAPGAAPDTGRR